MESDAGRGIDRTARIAAEVDTVVRSIVVSGNQERVGATSIVRWCDDASNLSNACNVCCRIYVRTDLDSACACALLHGQNRSIEAEYRPGCDTRTVKVVDAARCLGSRIRTAIGDGKRTRERKDAS
jgi:hypothetical protein